MKAFVAPVAVGVVAAGALVFWAFATRHTATPEVVEGWAGPNDTGTAISVHTSEDATDGNSYLIAGADWAGRDDVWHDGSVGPSCVGTDPSTRVRVRLGIVNVTPVEGGIGGQVVAWLRCLD
ncbi:hypothetical protein B1813_10690 [Saccharomonospora piscinae]|uniref:Uncharacterized protein n=1 Tax=Saccharomonospora piscinae TaxID=687388 RepID=A0A1V9A6H7_SACPI|nr:hypothetical protein B1813_10690 [Saccharomonospora piscinae]